MGPIGAKLHMTQSCHLVMMYCKLDIIFDFNQILACNQILAFIQTATKFHTYLFCLTL